MASPLETTQFGHASGIILLSKQLLVNPDGLAEVIHTFRALARSNNSSVANNGVQTLQLLRAALEQG